MPQRETLFTYSIDVQCKTNLKGKSIITVFTDDTAVSNKEDGWPNVRVTMNRDLGALKRSFLMRPLNNISV